MKTPKILLNISLLLVYSMGFSQVGYKSLLRAAQKSTQQEHYDAAILLLLKAKSLKNTDKDYSDKVNMYLGNNYEALGKIDSCIYYYSEAVKFCEPKRDFAALSFLFSRLGNIEASFSGRHSTAINYFKKQLRYDHYLKDSTNVFECLNNIGLSFKSLNQLDSAYKYFNKVASNNSKYNHAKNYALLFIADIFSLNHNHKKALIYYNSAIKGLELANDSTGLYNAFANKGDYLMQQNRLDESLISLKKAQQFLSPNTTAVNKAVLYHNFAYVFSRQRVYDKAFYYKNLENVTLEDIKTESIGNAVAEMNAKYELRQKQDSLFINSQKLILADAKTAEKERNFIILLMVSATILIILISLYRIRQLRFKNTLLFQEAKQKALKLAHQYQLSESELKAIRSQMNPHFIFNVLNSIESYIMDNDKRTASKLIQKFASLSRLILENSTKSLVIAEKEWKALTLYTELEAMRYNDAFSFNFIVAEQLELKKLLLPPMLIQPLIENAILHGLIKENKPNAHLEVNLKTTPSGISITVIDNGVGINTPKNGEKFDGIKEQHIGLESIKERIEIINQQQNTTIARFTIGPGIDDIGTVAVVYLPLYCDMEINDKD